MLAYKGLTNFESALGKVSIVTGCVALEARKHGMIIPTFVEGPTREAIFGTPLPISFSLFVVFSIMARKI